VYAEDRVTALEEHLRGGGGGIKRKAERYEESPFIPMEKLGLKEKKIMKKTLGSLLLVAMMLAVMVPVTSAQLGDCDLSSFSVQNLGALDAEVWVRFYSEAGAEVVPANLNATTTNPFSLAPGGVKQIYVPGIPDLPDGRYSVVIESTEAIAAIANLIGYTGACGPGNWPAFNGSYSGFDAGQVEFYLPSIVYSFSNWNSLLSVQNTTDAAIDVTVTIKDPRGNPDRVKSYTAVPAYSAVHLDLETEGGALGLVAGLNGSAVVNATGAVVVTDNQTAYAGGNGLTQSYNGFLGGATTLYAPALYNMFPAANGWRSSINVQNIGAANTNVTVQFSDGGADMACSNNPLGPGESCLLYMPDRTGGATEFSGVIVSSAEPIVGLVNASNGNLKEAQTYSAIPAGSGSGTVSFAIVMKTFPGPTGGWNTNFLVQNIGAAACDALTIDYSDDPDTGAAGPSYQVTGPFDPGEYYSVYQPADTNLPANWYSGAVSVTCNNGQPLAGIVNQTNAKNNRDNGDWSMSYNGVGQ
jgi:hypothetical protein